MSSFTRRIQRQLSQSYLIPHERIDGSIYYDRNMPRKAFFSGRGGKLGVKNPSDPCVTGKRKAPKVWRSKDKAPAPKPKKVLKESPTLTRAEVIQAHNAKMSMKASRSYRIPPLPSNFLSAGANRHTELPHEHKREIARRLRQNA